MDMLPQRTFVDPARPKKEKKPRTRLRPFSKKRGKLNEEYKALRKEYLLEHPYCQWFLAEHGLDEEVAKRNLGLVLAKRDGEWEYIHVPKATQIHHRKGRVGLLLIDIRYWLAVSDEGHKAIHHDTKTAYEKGYMLPR